ncbi:MAG: 3-deoxy-manno-octulosonate-8-phosphatase KdsC [Pseudomonadota bacterium]|nr:3-deoxy-manno-octulosonate-8-phosphatase KdsC [Pseudomonadota bacterium]
MKVNDSIRGRAQHIRLVVFDVDGVLTDGRIYLTPEGPEMKVFHARDGMGIRLLREHGIEVAVISGRQSEVVNRRMNALNVAHVIQGQDEKTDALRKLTEQLAIPLSHCAFIGDDVIDIPPMQAVGLACAVADAHPAVRRHAHWITTATGGHGAAREVCDMILMAQERLPPALMPDPC